MRIIRIAIPLFVLFAVMSFGAVQPWSEAILEIGAAVLLVIWAFSATREGQIEMRWNDLLLPMGGLVALALVQWATGFTAYRYVTKLTVMQLAAELILLFLAIQVFRTPRDWKALVWFLMSLAFAVSVFGIVQYFTWNGRIYWTVALSHGGQPFGPFVDRDDFAGFVELILPLGLGLLLFEGEREDRPLLIGLFAIFPAAALLMSGSRAGILCFLFELFLLGILVGILGRRSQRWLLAGMAVATVALAVWLGMGYTMNRFTQSNGTAITLLGRWQISADTFRMFLHNPIAGTGLGTFETAFPLYQSHYLGLVVNHAHNDYLELLSEAGLLGGLCGLAFLVILYRRGIRNLRRARSPVARSLYAGGLVSCTGLLLHEVVDFNLHILSNAIIFLIVSAMLTAVIPEPIANPRHPSYTPHLRS